MRQDGVPGRLAARRDRLSGATGHLRLSFRNADASIVLRILGSGTERQTRRGHGLRPRLRPGPVRPRHRILVDLLPGASGIFHALGRRVQVRRVAAGPAHRCLSAFPPTASRAAGRGQGPDRECIPTPGATGNRVAVEGFYTAEAGPVSDRTRSLAGRLVLLGPLTLLVGLGLTTGFLSGGFLLAGVALRFRLVLLSLALVDQAVVADDDPDDLLSLTQGIFDDASNEFDRATLDVNHWHFLPLVWLAPGGFPDHGSDANVSLTCRTPQVGCFATSQPVWAAKNCSVGVRRSDAYDSVKIVVRGLPIQGSSRRRADARNRSLVGVSHPNDAGCGMRYR